MSHTGAYCDQVEPLLWRRNSTSVAIATTAVEDSRSVSSNFLKCATHSALVTRGPVATVE